MYLQETRPGRVQKGSTAGGSMSTTLSISCWGREATTWWLTWSCCWWCSLGETTPHLWTRIRSCRAKKQEASKPQHRDGSQTLQTGLRCPRPKSDLEACRCWNKKNCRARFRLLWEPVKTTGRRVTFQTKNVTKKIHSISLSFFLKYCATRWVALFVYLSVCLYPINVKTAEPIWPKFFVGHHVTTGKVYEWSKFQIFVSIKIWSSLNFLKFWKSAKFFVKIRELFLFCFTMYRKRTCSQLIWKMDAKRPLRLVY